MIYSNRTMACLPQTWSTSKRRNDQHSTSANKKARTQSQTLTHVMRMVLLDLQRAEVRAPEQMDSDKLKLNESMLFEAVPFARSLSSIREKASITDVPLVSRAYEERYMRECMCETEKPCVMGQQCECMLIDPKQKFVGVQFTLPGDTEKTTGMCVLCLRKTTQLLFYYVVDSGNHIDQLIQRHGNMCGQGGEYHISAMLVCPPNGPVQCMPLPIVAHQRNRYSVEMISGIRYVKQHNVHFEDFCKAP